MKAEITVFNHPQFGDVRTMVDENGNPWFVGTDIAITLGYAKPSNALNEHVDDDDRKVLKFKAFPKTEQASLLWSGNDFSNKTMINESGVYSLIISSKLPQAKQFKHWVTSEVLPSIRKTGSYSMTQHEGFSTPTTYGEALMLAAQNQLKIEAQQKQLELQSTEILQLTHEVANMEKKVSYLDTIMTSKSTVKVKTIAQDYGMTAIAFNQMLHEYDIQYRSGEVWILYVKYLKEGYVKDVPFSYTHKDGTPGLASNMQWTQKGRMFLYHFLKEKGVLPLIEQTKNY